jgi:hypothetical protein
MAQKYRQTLEIPFGTIPWKRRQLGIPFRGKNTSKLSEIRFEPFHGRENNS